MYFISIYHNLDTIIINDDKYIRNIRFNKKISGVAFGLGLVVNKIVASYMAVIV